MQKIDAVSPESRSVDLVRESMDDVSQLFPEAVSEGKIDFEVLRELLSGVILETDERFGLNWHGKRKARQAALATSSGTLRPCPAEQESLDWATTNNIVIEGDNLEVLKLLQRSYHGQVKLIYIDPPYNTGNDFIYPDNFSETLTTYLQYTGQLNAEGGKFSTNTESSGRFHSKWLSMMYPRLKLAQRLLDKDGLLVVQIGDTELANLKGILDEIFGPENYLNTVSVKAKVAAGASGGGEDKRLKKNVEFLLIYARDVAAVEGFTHSFVEEPLLKVIGEMREAGQSWKYTNVLVSEGTRKKLKTIKDGDGNPIDIYKHEGIVRRSLRDVCQQENIDEATAYLKYLPKIFSDTNAQTSIRTRVIDATGPLDAGSMYSVEYVPTSGRDKGQRVCHYYISPTVRRVIWLKDVAYAKGNEVIKRERTGTLWDDISYNNIGKEGGVQFPNGKKPVELLKRVLGLTTNKEGIFLDFFAGSGTTAHAIALQNMADGGSRRFVLVQLPEPIDEDDDDMKWAVDLCNEIGKPRNISEITKERVRRVARKLKEDNPLFAGDLGFRVFKLDSSNIRAWEPGEDMTNALRDAIEHVKKNRTEEDILFELLLKFGLELTVEIEQKSIGGKNVFSIGSGTLLVCLAQSVKSTEVEALGLGIVKWHKELAPVGESICVFRDSAFADDVAKTNLTAILQQNGIENVRSL